MRLTTITLAAFAALSLAACSKPADKAVDAQANAVEAQGEMKADAFLQEDGST